MGTIWVQQRCLWDLDKISIYWNMRFNMPLIKDKKPKPLASLFANPCK